MSRLTVRGVLCGCALIVGCFCASWTARAGERFDGQFYHGEGDAEYLKLLDIARRMYSPDPEFQNIGMF